MKNLYRRYRPIKLEDVVGQEQVTTPLAASLKQGKINHAYLFIGPRGCGKTSVARILAHEVNGFKYELEDDYVDIIEIDGASNRGIDNIRELREKAAIAPTSGKYKIYIIDEVHMLTKEAFNALLKTLEEPPQHVIFIMATTDAYKVPVTITSRSQIYTFKLADDKVMFDFLKSIVKKEKIKISDDALQIIVKGGGGSFRDSLSLLDQISTLSEEEITKEMVTDAMGLPEDEKISDLLSAYLDGNVVKITTILKDLLASGIKVENLAGELINTIIDAPRPEFIPLLEKLPDIREPFAEAKLLVAFLVDYDESILSRFGVLRSAAARALAREPRGDGRERRDPECDKIDSPQEQHNKPVLDNYTTLFDFDGFKRKIESLNEVVFKQLNRCEYEVVGDILHLYPKTKIIYNIMNSKNNKKILVDNAIGFKIELHPAGEHPKSAAKDETLEKISAIMGGEVKNDGGYDPF